MLIPLSAITVQEHFNPRHHFDEAGLADLRRSLTEQGQIQALTVRPDPANDGKYLLVAGERRLRSMRELGWQEAKAEVVNVSERDAKLMALDENIIRRDLSPADEARCLRTLLDAFDGDRAEVSRRLGWSSTKMASRLALLHASDEVLDALAKAHILLGHAELLAAIPKDMQAKPLARILDEGLTVAQVREALSTASLPLADAIFDTGACARCPHNSSLQATLFGENIGEGRCSHRACYQEKSKSTLVVIRSELEERVAVVALASERDNGTTASVSEAMVGCGSWAGCLSCARFGAIIQDRLGPQCGSIEQAVCFDVACRSEKIAQKERDEHKLAAAAASQSDASPDTAHDHDGDNEEHDEAIGDEAIAPTTTASTSKPAPTGASGAKHLRPVLQDHFDAVIRRGAVSVLDAPEPCLAVICLALHQLLSKAGVPSPFAEEPDARHRAMSPATVAALAASDRATLQEKLMQGARDFVAHTPPGFDQTGFDRKAFAARLVADLGVALEPHVVVDESLLQSLNLSEIAAWLETSGFKARVLGSTDGKAKWAKFAKLNKGETVKAIVASGFPFADFLPPGLTDHARARCAQA